MDLYWSTNYNSTRAKIGLKTLAEFYISALRILIGMPEIGTDTLKFSVPTLMQ